MLKPAASNLQLRSGHPLARDQARLGPSASLCGLSSYVFRPGFFQIITSEQLIWALGQEFCIKISVTQSDNNLFEESYRVVAVEAERLIIKGIITGTVLTIVNSDPGTPLTAEEYPLGNLIVLSDPSASAPN